MSDNYLKTPLGASLNSLARQRAEDTAQALGKSLPCHVTAITGSIVTVAFDVDSPFTLPSVTMPLAGSEYARVPIQVGCKGYAVPADAELGGLSGLGAGTATMRRPGTLSALVFHPFGCKEFSTANVDPNKHVIYGPDGAVIRDAANASSVEANTTEVLAKHGSSSMTINDSGISFTTPWGTWSMGNSGIGITWGSHSIVVNSTGVIIDGKVFLTHEHSGVTAGGSNTGEVV